MGFNSGFKGLNSNGQRGIELSCLCVYFCDWSRCLWIQYLYAGEGCPYGSRKKPTDVEVLCEVNSFRHCDTYEVGRVTNGTVTQFLS